MRKIVKIYKGKCIDLIIVFVEALALEVFISKIFVLVGVFLGIVVRYILLGKVGILLLMLFIMILIVLVLVRVGDFKRKRKLGFVYK